MKYLKKFTNTPDYESFKGGEEWLTPNVSLITDVNTIMYTPKGVNLSVTIASNQSNDTTITNVAQATIKYGSVTITAKNGDIVNVPKNNSIVVSFSQVEDYKTPDTQIFTTGTGDISVNGLYQTEVVNVNITAENGESLNGVVITINSKDYTYNGSTISVKVPFDVTYNVIFGSFSGLTKPQTLTYVASQVSRDVTGEYIEKPNELIAIYDVTTTSSSINLLGSSFNISQVSKMWIDDVEVTPTTKYIFSTTGKHIVKILMSTSFNTCSYMFYNCSSLTSLDLSNFDTSRVTNMGNMFYNCSSLTSLDLSNFDTSRVTNMGNMFQDCSSLTSLDLSNFNTSRVTDMYYMFYNCSSLTSLDLSNFDTSSMTSMNSTFYNCSSLTTLDLSNFDTSSVTYMGHMFYNCSSLTSLDLSNFDTSSVTYMGDMFSGCSSLTSLDLSNFDTSSVKNMGMGGMFSICKNLKSIKLGDKVANTKVSSSTFGNSSSYYTGYNSRSTGENKLYVPVGATGYDTGYWLDPLQNTSRCGFTIVYSL